MRLLSAARVAAFTTFAVLTAACFVGSSGDGGSSGADDPGQRPPEGAAAEEFKNDLNDAVGSAQQYWQERFKASGEQFRPIGRIIPYTRDGEVACGQEALPRKNAAYCSAGDFIAYDVNWAAGAFEKVGDAFLYYLLGHEYAHGIQLRLQKQYRYTIEQELQADCMAGAYIGDSVRSQLLTLDDGDLDEFKKGLLAVGDDPSTPWFTPGAHGTARQRTDAFFGGYEKSLDVCDLG